MPNDADQFDSPPPDAAPEQLHLARGHAIPVSIFAFTFARSGGPGGQNVNKVSSKALLRVPLTALQPFLSPHILARLRVLGASHITDEGDILITDDTTRSQMMNKQSCVLRLRNLLNAAIVPPKPRIATKPTYGSKQRRLEGKRHRSAHKQQRRGNHPGDE